MNAATADDTAAANHDWIPLSDPDMSMQELEAVQHALSSPRVSSGALAQRFETAFAQYLGRAHAVAVSGSMAAMMLALKALGIQPGDEVITGAFGWRNLAHAIALVGATPVFVDVDYWTGSLAPDKAEAAITPKTKALIAANTAGHPAAWTPLRNLAAKYELALIEDSAEAIGSRYAGHLVGTFGDIALFDFSQPAPLTCGEGAMLVTDDAELAAQLRHLRGCAPEDRASVVGSAYLPQESWLSDIHAALGLVQLQRLGDILHLRKLVETMYLAEIQSFEGIKPPYIAPEVTEMHWFMYLVHLGTRFTRSSRDAIINDLHTNHVEAAAYCHPAYLGRYYLDRGARRGHCLVTEKLADRAIVLPFHAHLTHDQVRFIVKTAKDASVNVGAGAAIYL